MTTYSWMFYNTTNGALAPQHSTHSPLISKGTTTLTPTGGQATMSTTSSTGAILPLGTTTTTSENKNPETGAVLGTTTVTTEVSFDSTLIPVGNALVGIYDDANYPMPSEFQTAYETPNAWLYQNGSFVANPSYNADAVALAQAKAEKLTQLQSSYDSHILAGFTSTADGTARQYPGDSDTIQELLMLRSAIQAGVYPNTPVFDVKKNKITLTQTQATTLIDDAQTFWVSARNNMVHYEDAITQATDMPTLDAITFTW